MIYKKQYGHPFDTESVVGSFVPAMETIPYLTREPDGFSYAMDPQDILYGLGENIRGINKRGWVYESKCSDDPNHTENKSSLYGAYNFMIVSGKATFGFFIDYPGKVTFDCGYTDLDTLRVTVAEENYDLYIIEGESPTDIVHQFRQLVGRSYIPPKWAFGATQSRWSYMNEDEVREVVANYRTNNMPLDAVVLDIDYMERYKDFTVDEQRFPHFADFAAEMKAQGIRLVPIIDAGVKIEDGYDVYEEGVTNGYFCTNQDGTPFVAGVWPGRVHFPDMLNPEARAWFGSKYKLLLNQANVDTQLIFVEGGTFSGRNPAEGDDNMGGTFLAEGYKAVENGDGTWVVRKKENNAQVGGKNYEELSDAIEASNSIDNTITLTKNTTVKLENGVANGSEKSRNITIKGDGTQTVDVITRAISAEGGMLSYQRGSTFTFKNVTIQAGEGSFDGIVCDELVYNNCIIKGKLTLYGKATFINCTFENEMANQYSIWTWGGTDVRFEDCTFNTNGKAILLYGQATAEKPTNLTVSNCTFNDRNNGSAGKAAIEIGNDYNATYSLTVTSATVNGFADGKNTGSKIWANKNSMDAEHLTVIIDNKYVLGTETPKQTVTVATAEELKEKLTTLTSAGSGNNVINIDGDFQLANGETWTPVTVDGYNGAGVITINGNGHTIKGLNAPLIAGGFAGKSGVVIKDLTLENVTINDTNSNQGIGAFIGNVDSMPQIDLDNCHLINSNITSTDGARVGCLIGWTSGYNNPNDGPVNTCVSITNCSVENCAITAKGSVGAIIGHAGANPETYHTITGCTVKDCTLTSTDDGGWRVGVVVGTANVGEVTIKNITTDNNTVTQTGKTAPEGQSDLYGRFVPGETGKLTIDNIEIK